MLGWKGGSGFHDWYTWYTWYTYLIHLIIMILDFFISDSLTHWLTLTISRGAFAPKNKCNVWLNENETAFPVSMQWKRGSCRGCGVNYELEWQLCPDQVKSSYIGETSRNLYTRSKEHLSRYRSGTGTSQGGGMWHGATLCDLFLVAILHFQSGRVVRAMG